MENQQERKRGRPSKGATMKCSIMLEPDMHEWAMEQRGGLAETARRGLRELRAKGDGEFRVEVYSEAESLAGMLAKIPEDHRGTLIELVRLLSNANNNAYKLEHHVYLGEEGEDIFTFHRR